MELKAGMWIAQGPETNILLRLCGKAPMLEVMGGIDLNYFYAHGKAKELCATSPEIVDIMSYPENYTFCLPSITEVVANIEGLGSSKFESYKPTPEELAKCVSYYKDLLPFYGQDRSKAKLRIFIKNELGLRMGQATLFSNEIIRKILKGE